MKKTVTANIGGVVFHIEEDAYQELKQYLDKLEASLGDPAQAREIVSDIESRIAEILSELLAGRQVVTLRDIQQVEDQMGHVEDIREEAGINDENTPPPAREPSSSGSRKIYRDPDDNILGGVCSGIAHYFGWQPLWVRLFFAFLLLGLGTGVLLYIVLWILIPKAETAAEKLEMKGEPVTAENIKQQFSKVGDEFKKAGSQQNREKVRGAVHQLGEVFGKIAGVTMLVISVVLLIFLGYWIITKDFVIAISGSGTFSLNDLMDITLSGWQLPTLQAGIILATIGPVIALVNLGIRLVFDLQHKVKLLSIVGGVTWVMGIILLTIMGIDLGRDFTDYHKKQEVIEIRQPQSEPLVLTMQPDDVFSDEFVGSDNHFWELISRKDDMVYLGWPELSIRESKDNQYRVMVKKSARGRNRSEAIERTENISYKLQQEGNKILLSPYFVFPESWRYRIQRVEVIVYVPEGKDILIDRSVRRMDLDDEEEEDDEEVYPFDQPIRMTDSGLRESDGKYPSIISDTLEIEQIGNDTGTTTDSLLNE